MRFIITTLFLCYFALTTNALTISKHANDHKGLNAITLEGTIEEGDTYRLKLYISSLTKKKNIAVYLDSKGGNLLEGMQLGRLFRSKKIKTVIQENAVCASSCALAFLGGFNKNTNKPWRTKTSNSGLGFHTFYNNYDTQKKFTADDMFTMVRISQLLILEMIIYFEEMGVSKDLLKTTLSTNSNDMYWITNSEALEYGFHVWDTQLNKLINADNFLAVLE